MFSKPHAGWTNIKIGDYRGNGSYLTDIPLDFLNAAKHALKNNVPFVLFIDEEGIQSYITSFHDETFINRTTDTIETYYSQMGFKDLISEGLRDIDDNIADWVRFAPVTEFFNYNDEELKARTHLFHELMFEICLLLSTGKI